MVTSSEKVDRYIRRSSRRATFLTHNIERVSTQNEPYNSQGMLILGTIVSQIL